jgi:uncharacterized protein CbrC (UPF0167 family)
MTSQRAIGQGKREFDYPAIRLSTIVRSLEHGGRINERRLYIIPK